MTSSDRPGPSDRDDRAVGRVLARLDDLVDAIVDVGSSSPMSVWRSGVLTAGDPHAIDQQIETALIERIDRVLDHPTILSEEDFRSTGRERNPGCRVRAVLDPLDGTRSFMAGEETHSISLAVEVEGVTEVAIVHHPVGPTTYTAVRGSGARVDGQPIVCPIEPVSRTVAVKSALHRVGPIGERCATLRAGGYEIENLGSTALKLCWLATGRRAGVLKEIGLHGGVRTRWGVAAGALICRESGVRVLELGGAPWTGASATFVAADRAAHATMAADGQDGRRRANP